GTRGAHEDVFGFELDFGFGAGATVRALPEFGSIINEEASTPSKAPAGTVFSSSSIAVGQPFSAVPVKYQSEPLSATINPYFFIAVRTTLVSERKPDRLKPDFSRKRAPIGGM